MIGKTVLIGFGCKARRGKDTAVSAILSAVHSTGLRRNLDVRRYAFADALKREVESASFDQYAQDGFPLGDWNPLRGMVHLCKWAEVRYDHSQEKQRALLQWWGTEYRRKQDCDYWVKRLGEQLERDQPDIALIPDVRFANEFELCDYRVRMDRPGFEIADGAHHVSETTLDALPDSAWSWVIRAADPAEVEYEARRFFASFLTYSGLIPERSNSSETAI